MAHYTKHLFICTNQKAPGKKCCSDTGGELFVDYIKERLLELELHGPGKVRVSRSGCLGRCKLGPCMAIYPEGTWYTYASFADMDEIINQHLIGGQIVERLIINS